MGCQARNRNGTCTQFETSMAEQLQNATRGFGTPPEATDGLYTVNLLSSLHIYCMLYIRACVQYLGN